MTTQIIPKPEILLNKIQALPPEQLQQIEDFIEFLTQKYVHPNIKDITALPAVMRYTRLKYKCF